MVNLSGTTKLRFDGNGGKSDNRKRLKDDSK